MKENKCESCKSHVNEVDLTKLPFGRLICSECMRRECEQELGDIFIEEEVEETSWSDIDDNDDDEIDATSSYSDSDSDSDNISLYSIGSYIRDCIYHFDEDDDDEEDDDDDKSTLTKASDSSPIYTIDDLIR